MSGGAGMNNLFEWEGYPHFVKLPRIKPKIMGVPVSIETVRDLSRASKDILRKKVVPEEIKQERLDICMSCPSWKNYRCMECGCQMRVKTTLTSSRCPKGKWKEYLDFRNTGINTSQHEESTE